MGILSRALETRDSNLKFPQQWLLDALRGGAASKAGVTVTIEGSLEYSAVLAAVRVLAESVAGLPCILYRRLPERGKERAYDHYLYPILHDAPNPRMTAFEFFEIGMVHLCLWGNFYAQVVRDGAGRVIELWPLRPDRMEIWQSPDGRELAYKYSPSSGGEEWIPQEYILHVRGMGSDGVRGYSLIRLARNAIGLGLAAEEFGSRFFANDARPGVVLQHPGVLGEEAFKRIRDSWEMMHGGAANAWRPAILEEGMTVATVGFPPEDAQFLETRKFQINEVARIFRIPPHMLQDLDRATFSNIEHLAIEFVVHTLRPWLCRWEQALTNQLLRPSERSQYFVEFLVEGLLRGDTESRYRAYAVGRQWGWLSPNDVRELENMNPIPGGDRYDVPLNMMPLESEPPAREESGGEVQRALEVRELRSRWQDRVGILRGYMPAMTDAFQRVINREVNDIRNAARRIWGGRAKDEWDAWLDNFLREHQDFFERYMHRSVQALTNLILQIAAAEAGGQAADIPEHVVAQWVEQKLKEMSARHVNISRVELRDAVEEARRSGTDPLMAVEAKLDDWSVSRAEKASHAETFSLGNAAALLAWTALGVQMMRWKTTSREPCPFCRRMDGMVVHVSGKFLQGGGKIESEDGGGLEVTHDVRYPPLHRGCECVIEVS